MNVFPKWFSIANRLLFPCIFLILPLLTPAVAQEPVASNKNFAPVIIQLKWFHQFQFAGYYAALHKGFYREEGLDVTIKPGGPNVKVNEEVACKRANFGVLASELIEKRVQGEPLVLLAVIMQHSIRAIIVRADSGIHSPPDLMGRLMMINRNEDAEFMAMFAAEGIHADRLNMIPKDKTANTRFIKGDIDALNGSIGNQPFLFRSKGIPVKTILPINYGIDFYGDSLFTSEAELKTHPERTEAFRKASIRGWEYAMMHTGEIIDLIIDQYDSKISRAHLQFEADAVRKVIMPDLIDIGHVNPHRIETIARIYAGRSVISKKYSLEGFIYDPSINPNIKLIKKAVYGFFILIAVFIFSACTLILFNLRLKKTVALRTEAIMKEKSLSQRYLDVAAVMIITIDLNAKVTLVNRKGCEILGYPEGKIIGKDWFDNFIPERFRDELKTVFEQLISGVMDPVAYYENRILTRNGEERVIAWYNNLVKDSAGRIIETISSGEDITERKRAEEDIRRLNQELEQRVIERTAELEAANKELEAFAYTVSHDLRAPLRHIDGFMDLLQEETRTALEGQALHYMDSISRAAQKMGLLIDDLLSFSRMGRHTLLFRPVDLGTLVHDIIRDLAPDSAGRAIEWHIGNLPRVTGDAAMLRVVLDNLIANALKFTRPRKQTRIEIGSEPGRDGGTVFVVRDNGVGFDMTYADKLFCVFQRLHRADEFEGTGIGMAIVKRIITRHGGRVWAEAKPDEGAAFYFSLPQETGKNQWQQTLPGVENGVL